MSAQLSLIPEIAAVPVFDGRTFDAPQDGRRLASQLDATRSLMLDGEWGNLAQIVLALRKQGLHVTEASISARLRDLRKARFGAHTVERRRIIGGLWEYRIAAMLLIAVLAFFSGQSRAEDLPNAPIPAISSLPAATTIAARPVRRAAVTDRLVDYSLWLNVTAAHALDWASTQECLRRPYAQCHESQLPNALVQNKVGFALFKGAEVFGAIEGQRLLERHGHRKIAYALQVVDIGLVYGQDVINYRLAMPTPKGARQ